jgi:general secretion pathway protein H
MTTGVRLKQQSGFTLLELMIVILIMGILMSFSVLTVTTGDAPDSPKAIMQQLHQLLKLATEESILENEEIGLEIGLQGYRFFLWEKQKWKRMTDNEIFRPREISAELETELYIEGQSIILEENEEPTPQIVFLSTGEISSFELQYTHKHSEEVWRFTGFPNGSIKLEHEIPEQ